MRLYNPDYQKNLQKNAKRNKVRKIIGTIFLIALILASVAMLVYIIVVKAKWYFYLVDIVGGFILCLLSCAIFPTAELEYMDFKEIPEGKVDMKTLREKYPDTKVISKTVTDIARKNFIGSYVYTGVFRGIAVCECGTIYRPEDVFFSVGERTTNYVHSENGNMTTSEQANVVVKCKCAKCGKEFGETFYGVERPTGSLKREHKMFSSETNIKITSIDADFEGFVASVYEQDKKRYLQDSAEYKRFLEKKQTEMLKESERKREETAKKIETLRAKGWYEKGAPKKEKDDSESKNPIKE